MPTREIDTDAPLGGRYLSLAGGTEAPHTKSKPPGNLETSGGSRGGGGDMLEARVARLESDVSHMRGDVSDIKQDIRSIKGWGLAVILATFAAMATLYVQIGSNDKQVNQRLTAFQLHTNSELADLKSDMRVVKSDIGYLKGDVGVLKTDVSSLKSDVGTLKADVGSIKQDVAAILAELKKQ